MVVTNIVANLGGTMDANTAANLVAPEMLNAFMGCIAMGVFIIVVVCFFAAFLKAMSHRSMREKSSEYRGIMSDMYVVGMVKKFAKDDSIDLLQELKEFNKIEEKNKRKRMDVDDVIEDNLKEKINAKSEEDLKKLNKEK
jgi:hypothetical protein